MAISQYIGARYVPKFYEGTNGSDWTANTQYEPLTIVTRNGNSYTSKKAVPANIGEPENNADYWASTGIYNQQVEQYRQEVQALDESVQGLDETVQTMDEDINAISADVNALKEGEYRKTIFIGDSYDTFHTVGWIDTVASKLGLSAADYYKRSQGGIGFVGNQPINFQGMLTEVASGMNEAERNSISAIVIAGGANDGVASGFETAVSSFATYAKNTFPNALVSVCFVGWSRKVEHQSNIRLAYDNYAKYITKYNMRYFPDCGIPLHNLSLLEPASEQHPTVEGVAEISNSIYNALIGGSYAYEAHAQVTPTAEGNFVLQTPVIRGDLIGDTIRWYFASNAFGNGSANVTPLNYGTDYNIATYDVSAPLPLVTPWTHALVTWDSQQNVACCEVRLNNGHVQMKWRGPALTTAIGGHLTLVDETQNYMIV